MKKTILALALAALMVGCSSAGPGYHKPNTPAQMAVSDSVRAKIRAEADTPAMHAKQLEGYSVVRFTEGKPSLLRSSGDFRVDAEALGVASKVAEQMTPEEKSYNITVGILFEVRRWPKRD